MWMQNRAVAALEKSTTIVLDLVPVTKLAVSWPQSNYSRCGIVQNPFYTFTCRILLCSFSSFALIFVLLKLTCNICISKHTSNFFYFLQYFIHMLSWKSSTWLMYHLFNFFLCNVKMNLGYRVHLVNIVG